jgi:Uma2 family endonuclease
MSDSRTSSSVNVAEIAEQRVVLRDVSWSTYESLLDDLADTSSPRLAYDEGTLEIMTPLGRHEALNRTLAMLVGALAEELGIDIQDYGSTTFRRKPHRKGFEPDSCFYVQHESAVRGKERLDLESDPPPDVAVEIELTSGAVPKLPIYAALGVPEVWRCDAERVRMFVLDAGQYREQPVSRAFPRLTGESLSDWLYRGVGMPRTSLLRDFRSWIRDGMPPSVSGGGSGVSD